MGLDLSKHKLCRQDITPKGLFHLEELQGCLAYLEASHKGCLGYLVPRGLSWPKTITSPWALGAEELESMQEAAVASWAQPGPSKSLWAHRKAGRASSCATLLHPLGRWHLTPQQPHRGAGVSSADSCQGRNSFGWGLQALLLPSRHPSSAGGTERTAQGSQLVLVHMLKYSLFSCISLPALFKGDLITRLLFGFVYKIRKLSSAPLKKKKKRPHPCQDVLGELLKRSHPVPGLLGLCNREILTQRYSPPRTFSRHVPFRSSQLLDL